MKKTIIHKHSEKCPRCGGKGWKFDHECGFFSLGIDYLFQLAADKDHPNMRCPNCNGTGYITVEDEIIIQQ